MCAGRPLACAVLLASLGAGANPEGPVEAAERFFEAQRRGRCDEVLPLFSKDSLARIGKDSACGRIGKYKPGTARLVRQVGPEAVVKATFRGVPGRHDFDVAAQFREFTEELDLLREDGVWKAELRRKLIGSSQARLSVPAGVVEWRREPLEGGIHHKLEASVASRVPREALEAVLLDARTWAAALPSFQSLEALPQAGGKHRALLSFAGSSAPIPVTMTVRERASLEWIAENGVEAPVYIRGSWNLHPNPDGTTRLNLTLVLNPRHWPDYERQFGATLQAKALDVFQAKAGKKP